MTKWFTALFACCFILPAFAQDTYRSASNPYYWKNRKPYEGYWQQDVHYNIKASVDDQTDIVDGEEELTYYNNSPDTLAFVYFHLYQNAFTKGAYLQNLNRANGFKQQFGKYEADGKGTEIESLQVTAQDGQQSSRMVNGKRMVEIDNTIMKVLLQNPLLPGQHATFRIKFKTYFDGGGNQRRRMKTFKDAWGNKQYDGVHWYPRMCVYDRKFGWETDQHLGKEFYGDFGSYDVELTFPGNYVMDATGVLQNRDEVLPADLRAKLDIRNFKEKPLNEKPSEITPAGAPKKTWKFRAENVHDFAWVADPTFRIGESKLRLANGHEVSCIALAQEPHAARWQDAALFTSKVIETYSNDIGAYAYPKMIVADARDGMEYPMLTLDGGLSPGYYGLFAHEVGHNWFFGMVGNNETYRASLDEGFTQFLTNWSMVKLLGDEPKKRGKGYVSKYYRPLTQTDQTVYLGYIRDAINHNDMPLNTHSDDFNGALNHGGGYGHVYYKTATMLYNLQYVLGDELFLKAMQHYFDQWKFCHPYFEDFRSSIISYTHADLNWFFDQWMETTKTIDYQVTCFKRVPNNSVVVNSKQGFDLYSITLKRKGEMQMPVDFTVFTKDSSYRFIVPNTYFVKAHDSSTQVLPVWRGWGLLDKKYTADVLLPSHSRITNVQIDPTHRLADINELNNSIKCPVLFTFDHQVKNPLDRKHYILKWRPDVWYNNYDGIKAGLHFNGNYMGQRHVFRVTAWYNTGAFTQYTDSVYQRSSPIYPVHYNASYQTRIGKFTDLFLQSRLLDGLFMNKIGIEKNSHGFTYRAFFKSMRRTQLYYLPAYYPVMSFYPQISSENQWNNTLNLEIEKDYSGFGSGKWLIGMRTSAIRSDFDYSSIYFNLVQHSNLSKFELRTRIFGQYMTGSHFAPESQLYLAGANPEEMADNKFTRSAGIVPYEWSTYGINTNHFQYGGGLNIRGYNGYLVPVNDGATQYYLYKGNTGAAVNLELDYDRFFRIPGVGPLKYFHLDSYLFFDGGILRNDRPAAFETGAVAAKALNTGFMASAGPGFALTIKNWGRLDEIKPLTIRFDMPLYLSNAPFADNENLKFRWLIGVNRAF